MPIASITKLMTALVLIESSNWNPDDTVSVLRSDVREGGKWFLRFGDIVSKRDVLGVMLVASGNNETLALVRSSGFLENEFVDAMNKKASELGMIRTHFQEPVCLSDGNVSAADDLPLLWSAALDVPAIEERMEQPEILLRSKVGNGYSFSSTDILLGSFLNSAPYKILGGKTGSLDGKYSLVMRVRKDDRPIDVVVLGAANPEARFNDAKALASWTYRNYSWR